MTLGGLTIAGEKASWEIRVCGAGAYVVLKALAFRIRGENKDACDLFYLLRNYGKGVADVAELLRGYSQMSTQTALAYLREDFLDPEGIGPRRLAEFLYANSDPETQAEKGRQFHLWVIRT